MAKINYQYKAQLLTSDDYKSYKEMSKAFYNHFHYGHLQTSFSIEDCYAFIDDINDRDPNALRELFKIDHAFYQKKKRLQERIKGMLEKPCIFATFTFTDHYLNSLDHKYLKKYLTAVLRKMSDCYIANEDYGKKHGRLHYHAIIQAEFVDSTLWTYGACNVQKINIKDPIKLGTYITKLSNHAIKTTNKRSVMIYSKRIK